MKIIFRTRYPLRRIILLLLLSAASSFYYLQIHTSQNERPAQASLMPISPIVQKIDSPAPTIALITRAIPIKKDQTFSELMQSAGFGVVDVQEIYDSALDV